MFLDDVLVFFCDKSSMQVTPGNVHHCSKFSPLWIMAHTVVHFGKLSKLADVSDFFSPRLFL